MTMAEFRVIDADSHVEEPEEAWGYLDPKYEARRPFSITGENRPFLHNMNSSDVSTRRWQDRG
jgi:hypothetical protein